MFVIQDMFTHILLSQLWQEFFVLLPSKIENKLPEKRYNDNRRSQTLFKQ